MKIVGQVQRVEQKNFRNGGSAYYLHVEGREYRVGNYPPRDVSDGDWVEFEADAKQNGQYTNYSVVPRTLRKSAPQAQQNPAPRTGDFAASQQPRKYEPFDERQEIISKQAALNTASGFVNMCVANGMLPFAANTKAANKIDLLRTWWLDEAAKVYNLTTGRAWAIGDGTGTVEADEPDEAPAYDPEEQAPGW